MKFRHRIEVILTLVITLLFQYLMMGCISSMHKTQDVGEYLNELSKIYSTNQIPEYVNIKKQLILEVNNVMYQHNLVFYYVVICYFTYPLKFISLLYFYRKTQSTQYQLITINDTIDILLTIAIILWIYYWVLLSQQDNNNQFMVQIQYPWTNREQFVLNAIWLVNCDINASEGYTSSITKVRFDYIIGFVALFIWIKMLMLLKYIKSLGSIFVIISKLSSQLLKYLSIWIVEIMIFTSVSLLLLGQLQIFQNFIQALAFLLGGIFEYWYN